MAAGGQPAQQGSEPKARIFISYSRKDMDFADRLEAALKTRGFEPLIDRTEIYAFEDWWKRIEALIGRADTVVFVVSPDAVASDVALKEVAHAASLNKRFAPIVCRHTDEGAVPDPLRRLNFIFFDDPAHFEPSADQLAEALSTDIGWVRQHTEYGEAARRWALGGRKGGLLLRSPVLEEAERWIASRPRGAPEPTTETQTFVADSRRGASRRRNVLSGSLAAGLLLALVLAGLAFWQRDIAVEQRTIADQQRQFAEQQRKRAEDTLAAATTTANSLVSDLAQRFKNSTGIPAALIKDILDRARALQDQLINSGQATPDLRRSEAGALDEIVNALLVIGDTTGALAAASHAQQIFADLAAANPGSTDAQRDLSVSYIKVGDAQKAQGDLASALKSYQASLAIFERLAQSNSGNLDRQIDLSTVYSKVGDVQMAQRDLPGALKSYQAAFAIAERLAQSDSGNALWQRDLSIAYNKVGDVQVAQHDLAGAMQSYRASLAVAQGLAQSDPRNAEWQRDLSVVYEMVGNVQMSQRELAGALKSYQASLAINRTLAESDLGNSGWQRDLSVAYDKVGDVQMAQRDLSGALKSYRAAFAIAERLAQSDSGNASWQRDLLVECVNIAAADPAQARTMLTRALQIANNMKAKGILAPSDAWMPDELAKRIAALPQ
jgi:tetratricopeptide (TPR) repeat protein